MKKRTLFCIIACLLLLPFSGMLKSAEPKLAQTGFQFLSVTTDARSSAMGEAFTAVGSYSASIFHNPAYTAQLGGFMDVSLNHNTWIADINHTSGSLSLRPWLGRIGIFTVSMMVVDYGTLQGTVVDRGGGEKGYFDTGDFSPSAYAVGVGYSKFLSDRFAFGVHVKYAGQDLGSSVIPDPNVEGETTTRSYSEGTLAYDFGTIYKTGFRSLAFGMSVQNFSQEVKYETEGFQLPLNFRIGVAMDVIDLTSWNPDMHQLLIAVDATHPRSAPEQLKIGGEYILMNALALRAGYTGNVDERGFTAGAGVNVKSGDYRIGLDYAYTPFGVFDNVQRFSFNLSF